MNIRKPLLHALVIALFGLVPSAFPQDLPIDTGNSKVHVYVSKSGLFSGFADNHEVEAPLVEGTINESGSRVKFVIDARQMKVLDPRLSADKRQQVQERMLGPEVLDSMRFPQITFESTNVEPAGPGQILVSGRLSLHGVTRRVSATVRKQDGRYVGTCTLKQRDFGIAPISIAGGTVKVKDELKIEFDVRANTRIPGE
jgi:polyisoprenoid-binding protein YceI